MAEVPGNGRAVRCESEREREKESEVVRERKRKRERARATATATARETERTSKRERESKAPEKKKGRRTRTRVLGAEEATNVDQRVSVVRLPALPPGPGLISRSGQFLRRGGGGHFCGRMASHVRWTRCQVSKASHLHVQTSPPCPPDQEGVAHSVATSRAGPTGERATSGGRARILPSHTRVQEGVQV